MSISALILDLDGVLIDTETVGRRAWHRAANEMGFEFSEKNYAKLVGRSIKSCRKIIKTILPAAIDFNEYMARSNSIYHDEMERNGISIMSGVTELLQLIEHLDLDAAIATSSSRDTAERKIEISGLSGCFETMITSDDVKSGKPAPDIFMRTAERLNHPTDKCVVIEDSESGITGAHKAGAIPIMVPNTIPASENARLLSYSVEESLFDVLPTIKYLYFNHRSH